MPSLQSRVARLALESDGPLKAQLVAALRVAKNTQPVKITFSGGDLYWNGKEEKTKGRSYVDGGAAVYKAFRESGSREALYYDNELHFPNGSSVKAPSSLIGQLGMRKKGSEEDENEETDSEGKFEKGKKVPLSQLPEALQSNAENPPAAVQEMKDQMEKSKKKAAWEHLKDAAVKRASLDRKTLDQLVEMAAESSEYENTSQAQATPEVKMVADKFTRALSKALSVFVQKHPPEDGSTVEDLMDAEGAYAVFMTLEGHGVGIWDGRWRRFYKDTKTLERFLERALDRPHQDLQTAIENAAFETAGGE